jgi:hypothetical protein
MAALASLVARSTALVPKPRGSTTKKARPRPALIRAQGRNLDPSTIHLQRACAKCEDVEVRRAVAHRRDGQGLVASPAFAGDLAAARASGGQPLPHALRRFMEPRFGEDFAPVRLHADARADSLSRSIRARAFTVNRDIFVRPSELRSSSIEGRRLIAHELTHVVQQRGSSAKSGPVIQRQEANQSLAPEPNTIGPQSFAPAKPGTIAVDPALLSENAKIAADMMGETLKLEKAGDIRWFFAYAHAVISGLIVANVEKFQQPNALLRLNRHFASEFLRSIKGAPHPGWMQAFKFCAALGKANLPGNTELCGAAMANVHINVDLRTALHEVGCLPPQDYGNVLVFVNRASLAALARMRGRGLGAAEAIMQRFSAPVTGLDVKQWRNAAFMAVCKVPVPAPE